MMHNGRVSIIMPVYNAERFMRESIESIRNQTHTDWELLITDDCSTDQSRRILEEYAKKDPRIRIFFNRENKGAAGSRNVSLSHVEGEFVAFLDCDDVWDERKLELQIDFLKKNGYAFSATNYTWIDDDGNSLHTMLIPPDRIDYKKMLLYACPIGNSTVMYDRKVVGDQQVPPIRKRNDFALWLKILREHDIEVRHLDVPLTKYRKRKDSISAKKYTLIKYHWHLYHHVEKLNILTTLFYIGTWAFLKLFRIIPTYRQI